MAQKSRLEQRVATLEEEVARIKRQLRVAKVGRNWVKHVSGSLKDFPEFAEVVRLGQEFRRRQTDSSR